VDSKTIRQIRLRSAQAGVSALALATALTWSTAQAQDTAQSAPAGQTAQVSEVVVTGIRASLQSAAGRKRLSTIVQDSITQEDLGKFPDANVAESLQRIPGVSIDRSNGEGRFVTVRGLGPQFNTVLVNGRSFASDNYGREFSFDLLAAELISGADVYKSSQSRIQDGGIGATINLRTSRPLELKGFNAIVSAKANYEPNNKDTTPQAFALISDTFADGTFGLLGSISYQKRIATVNSVTSGGYLPNVDVGPSASPLFTNVYAPRNMDIGSARDERTRLGATLVGQWQPSDELLVTVDGLYNRFKSDSQNHALGLWFEPSQYTAATIDENRSVTSLTTNGNADMINSSGVRDTETYEAGVNVDWKPTDKLRVIFDATTSKAKNSGAGKSFFTVAGVPTQYSFTAGDAGELPSFGFDQAALTNPALARTHLAQRSGNDVTEVVHEVKLDTEWKTDGGAMSTVRFGGSVTSRRRDNDSAGTFGVGCFYCGYPTLADPSLFSTFNLGKVGSGGKIPTSFLQYDPNAYLAYLASPASLAARDAALGLAPGTSAAAFADQSDGHGYDAVDNPGDFVKEVVYAGYVEADFEGDVGGLPWFLNVGARYIHTELKSHSQSRALVDLLPVPNDPTIYNAVFENDGEYVPVDAKSSSDVLLPAVNLKIKLTDQINFRLAGSQTLTRPALNDLRPVTSYDTTRPASLEASGGNPDLKPYRANNFDASLEWYPTPTTTLSAAAFYKHINDFIVTTIENEKVTIANTGNLPVGGFITGTNEATFATARPRNSDAADVRGLEFNVVHTFDWAPGILSGFGVQANATFVKTNRTFDSVTPQQRFAVVGLGNSQNFTLFYEKYGLSARIAYNRREKFLSSISDGSGGEPLFVRTYGQFDGSASYDIRPNTTVFVEGTNLFNAKYVTQARFDNQLRGYYNYGSRFNVGVRMKF
jgi:iron complex outermembrane receptor protein